MGFGYSRSSIDSFSGVSLNMKVALLHILILVLLILTAVEKGYAQFQIIHTPPQSVVEERTAVLQFTIPGYVPGAIDEASVFFRTDRAMHYTREAAVARGNVFEVRLPASFIQGTILYYYLQLDYLDGRFIRFPSGSPGAGVIEVPIRVSDLPPAEGQTARIDYRIMSPLPGTAAPTNDALIAISFFYPEGVADASGFRLFVNGMDVTNAADVSPFLITYLPQNVQEGETQVQLIYRDINRDIELVSWSFEAVPPGLAPDQFAERQPLAEGDIELVARNQVNAGQNFDFVRGSFQLRGSQGSWRYTANGLLTTQESARLQPQNRYGLHVSYADVATLELGHVYPVMNPLLMAGRRIHGAHLQTMFPSRRFNLQLLHGESLRSVDPLFEDIQEVIRTRELGGGTMVTDTSYVFGLQPGGRGTFTQQITGARIVFGAGHAFQMGFNAIRVRDLTSSIPYFTEYDAQGMQQWQSQLSPSQRQNLAQNPDLLQITRSAAAPVSNFAAATDLQLFMDRNRIRISADAAASLYNNDISRGAFTAERAEELGFDISENLVTLFDRLSWLIVINENMNALPFEIRGDETEFFVPRGIFAYQSQLGFNYFNNALNVQYRWIGPDFVSLANNGIRRDITGFTVIDRIRLLSNTLYVNLLFERLNDNLVGQLDATTYTQTLGTGINWFPLNRDLPRVNLNIRHSTRDNRTDWSNPFIAASQIPTDFVRNAIMNSDNVLLQAPTPRLQRTLQMNTSVSRAVDLDYATHDIMLTLGRIRTTDEQFLYGDFSNYSTGLGVTSQFFSMPMRTSAMLNYTKSTGQSGLTSVRIFGLNTSAGYTIMDDNLLLEGEFALLRNRIETTPLQVDDNGDPLNVFNNRFVPDPDNRLQDNALSAIFGASATYRLYEVHHFRLSANYTNVTSRVQNLRFPNDHLVQFRYTYYF